MSHLVDSMAYVGAMPWHGLGSSLEKGQLLDIWEENSGLNWEINKSPVLFDKGNRSRIHEIGGFEDKSVLYRSDTGAPLSVVSQRYNVVQPREILEFYRDLTEVSGFELETAGVLKGGKKIWALARTGQSTSLKGNDVTKGYVLLATACDGSMATTAQFTSVRVVCNNTLAVSLLQEKDCAVKVSHSTRFDPQAVKKSLGISVSAWDDFMYQMKTLSERPVSLREARSFYHNVFSSNSIEGKTNERSMAKAISLFEGDGRGSQLASSKNTAFGLLNSVTEFIDHEKRARSSGHRMDSAWFGQGANVKQKALGEALLLTV
jgi:phage/plasmid-like protein (TIGR03299 family)